MCCLSTLTGHAEWTKAGAEGILRAVSAYYDVPRARMLWRVRDSKVNYARQVVYYLMREKLRWSYPRIAKYIQRRNHTTVMSGIEKIKGRVSAQDIEGIRKLLRADIVELKRPIDAEVHEFYFEATA